MLSHNRICGVYLSPADNIVVSVTPASAAKQEGEQIFFECRVDGTTKPRYWMRKSTGRRVGSGQFLSLDELKESDSDDYCCVVDVSSIQMEMSCGSLAVGKHYVYIQVHTSMTCTFGNRSTSTVPK